MVSTRTLALPAPASPRQTLIALALIAALLLQSVTPVLPLLIPPIPWSDTAGAPAAAAPRRAETSTGPATGTAASAEGADAVRYTPVAPAGSAPVGLAMPLPVELQGKPEMPALRTANSRTYFVGGNQYATVQEATPLHYQTASGAWEPIDPAYDMVAGRWLNAANLLRTALQPTTSAAEIGDESLGVKWAPGALEIADAAGRRQALATLLPAADAAQGVRSRDGSTITYLRSWSLDGVQDQWRSGAGRAEYAMRLLGLPRAPAADAHTLDLAVNLTLRPGTSLLVDGQPVDLARGPLETQGVLTFRAADGNEMHLNPPVAFEEHDSGTIVAGSYLLSAGGEPDTVALRVRTPWAWLAAPERRFPVVIDPLFQVRSSTLARRVFYEAIDNPLGDDVYLAPKNMDTTDLWLGRTKAGANRLALKFDLPRARPGSTVSKAYVYVVPNGSLRELGNANNVGVAGIVDDVWQTNPNAEPLANAAQNFGKKQVVFYSGAERPTGYIWDVTAAAQGWLPTGLFNPTNTGLLFTSDEERCELNRYGALAYTDYLCGALSFKNSSGGWTPADDLDPTQYLSNPNNTYFNPNSSSTGIRLIVWYTGPALAPNTVVDNPSVGGIGLPPSNVEPYWGADHIYGVPATPNNLWRAIVARPYAAAVGQNPPPNPGEANAYKRPNSGALVTKLQINDSQSGAQLLDRTLATGSPVADAQANNYEPAYILLNGRGAPGQYSEQDYQLRVINADVGAPVGYDVRLINESATINAVTGTRQVVNINNWNSEEPLRLYNLNLTPGTNALIKVEVRADNSNNNEYVGKYSGEFSARLFNSASGDDFITSSGQSQRAYFEISPALNTAPDAGGQPVPTPGGDTGIFTPSDGQYALAISYNGPKVVIRPEPEPPAIVADGAQPDRADIEPPTDLIFGLRVLVTQCAAGTFPTLAGGCQRVECPAVANQAASNYREIAGSGVGLWSKQGWSAGAPPYNSAATDNGTAPMIGPPMVGGLAQAPTIAVVGGKISVNAIGAITLDNLSQVMLVQCPAGGGDISNKFHVFTGPMERIGPTSNGQLRPVPATLPATNPKPWEVKKSPWRDTDEVDLKSQTFVVDPQDAGAANGSTAIGGAVLDRRVGETGGSQAVLKYNASWKWAVGGWPTFSADATNNTLPNPPDIASLQVNLEQDVKPSLDVDAVDPGAPDKIRYVDAVRHPQVTVTQQAMLGGASKTVQAVVLSRGVPILTTHYCAASCLDLRGPNDAANGPIDRKWAMPDVHTNIDAQTVMMSTAGNLTVYSTDHPDLIDPASGNAAASADLAAEYSFDAYKASVSVEEDYCVYENGVGVGEKVLVIKGQTSMALPNIGSTDGDPSTSMSAGFKLCATSLRGVHFEFVSPVGVPIGNSGLFLTGLKGSIDINPGYSVIKIGITFQAAPGGDGGAFRMTGEVTIDTRGLFAFQGDAKILGIVNATGKLWVAWNPLDTGFDVEISIGNWLDGFARAHFWKGQGWQNRYSWLPNNPNEEHFTGEVGATLTIEAGAIVDWALLVLPPDDISFGVEIAFGQFCVNSSCTVYEWGVKGAFEILGYDVGLYYGFDEGLDFILGNDDHILIDQYGGAQSAPILAAEGLAGDDVILPQPAPATVDGTATIPFTVKPSSEQILVAASWQAGSPQLTLVTPGGQIVNPGNAASFAAEYDGSAQGEVYVVKLPQAGVWQAVLANLSDTGVEHYKFIYLANKGAPGDPRNPADQAKLLKPAAAAENATNGYTIQWHVPADTPPAATISLYYSPTVPTTHTLNTKLPIVQNLPFTNGSYQWDTSMLASGDYRVLAVVDDGINDLPVEKISDPDNACLVEGTGLPRARAFDPARFPGTLDFAAPGTVRIQDVTPPAKVTGVQVAKSDGALQVRWNSSPEKDVTNYVVEWGINLIGGGSNKQLLVAQPGAVQQLRIGAVKLGVEYKVTVRALDASGNAGPLSDPVVATPDGTSNPVPSTPVTPTLGAKTATSVVVNWAPQGAVVPAKYKVAFELLGSAAPASVAEAAGTSTNLTNLASGRTYDVSVAACNAQGWCSNYSGAVRAVLMGGGDANGDGLDDAWAAAYGVSGSGNDNDGDGLNNTGEQAYGTDPTLQDSDGDGLTDKEEVDAGTDPLDSLSYGLPTQPRLALSDNKLTFTPKKQGNEAVQSQAVAWQNAGGGQLNLGATASQPWILPAVQGGNVQVTVNATNLAPGFYSGTVRLGAGQGSSGALVGDERCIRVSAWVLPADNDVTRRSYLPIIFDQ